MSEGSVNGVRAWNFTKKLGRALFIFHYHYRKLFLLFGTPPGFFILWPLFIYLYYIADEVVRKIMAAFVYIPYWFVHDILFWGSPAEHPVLYGLVLICFPAVIGLFMIFVENATGLFLLIEKEDRARGFIHAEDTKAKNPFDYFKY